MAAVEEEEVVALQFQEVANYQGTIEEAASARVIPEPELMPFNTDSYTHLTLPTKRDRHD